MINNNFLKKIFEHLETFFILGYISKRKTYYTKCKILKLKLLYFFYFHILVFGDSRLCLSR